MTYEERQNYKDLHAEDHELNVPKTPLIDPEEIDFKKFRNINGVKAKDDTQMVTREQAKFFARELKKCREDVVYFAEKYFYIVTWEGKVVIKLFNKQKEMLKSFIDNKYNIVCAGRQQGKCLVADTKVLIKNKSNQPQILSLKDIWNNNEKL